MTKPKLNLSHQSMQSNISKMRQIGSPSPLKSQNKHSKHHETNCLQSSIRSVEHCICHRFRYVTCCTIILIFSMMIALIIAISRENNVTVDFRNTFQPPQSVCNISLSYREEIEETIFTKISTIESNIQQKIELIENDIQTVKTQEQQTAEVIS
eukprot:719758_1